VKQLTPLMTPSKASLPTDALNVVWFAIMHPFWSVVASRGRQSRATRLWIGAFIKDEFRIWKD